MQILEQITIFSRASLFHLCRLEIQPSIVLTNDWFGGFASAWKKLKSFGDYFDATKFYHIIHNLGEEYQGRIYLDPHESVEFYSMEIEIPSELIYDDNWNDKILNPSRCALLCSDHWGTVSKSYKKEILESSDLLYLLKKFEDPFAYPNGIRSADLFPIFEALPSHDVQKKELISKFFEIELSESELAESILFGFIGRISFQKGVKLIIDVIEPILKITNNKSFFIIAGPIDNSEYSIECSTRLKELMKAYPKNVWADPDVFFNEGKKLQLGSDFMLIPSLYEPGGLVQHESFFAGTPVISFKTGGLKDSVHEWNSSTLEGNGFLFESHVKESLQDAFVKAINVFGKPSKYKILRDNASKSYIDLKQEGQAWRGELHRILGKVF